MKNVTPLTIPSFKLNNENFSRIFTHEKITTIRLGHKHQEIGLTCINNKDTGENIKADVWYVNHCLFSDLELNDARSDGFTTMEDLKAELRRCYQSPINDNTLVTQIHFNVLQEEAA